MGPGPNGGLEPPWYLLEEKHRKALAIQEVPGKHWWQLPDPSDREASKESCSAGP